MVKKKLLDLAGLVDGLGHLGFLSQLGTGRSETNMLLFWHGINVCLVFSVL